MIQCFNRTNEASVIFFYSCLFKPDNQWLFLQFVLLHKNLLQARLSLRRPGRGGKSGQQRAMHRLTAGPYPELDEGSGKTVPQKITSPLPLAVPPMAGERGIGK